MKKEQIVGTLVGESTSQEFRLAVTPESIREQDIIVVDAKVNKRAESQEETEEIRIWAKIQRIERINPLFPAEAGHELAETQTNPLDTVLSFSREMVSAVCQVLGYELKGEEGSKLESLRYPPKPATQAYRPDSEDLERVLVGSLAENQISALDIATLSNQPNDVKVNGHAIVTRHLAILAMTGAGKSWAARRVIEQLTTKNYPMVVFDPHGDYSGLSDIEGFSDRVKQYHANFPIFEQEAEVVAQIVNNLGDELSGPMNILFSDLFKASKNFYQAGDNEKKDWLAANVSSPTKIWEYGIQPNLWLIANIAEAAASSIKDLRQEKTEKFSRLQQLCGENLSESTRTDTLEAIYRRVRRAASELNRMEQVNQRKVSGGKSVPIPQECQELVEYGKISVVSLAGYTRDFQATIYSMITNKLFNAKVSEKLKLPLLFLLEEAHNFVPGRASSSAEEKSISITRQIAQEGRKFGVGLVVISQRPSRLDETTLSQCNSYIIMRMVNPADQTFVKRVVESLGEEEAKLLPNLEVGEALLSGQMVNFPILVKMKEPKSQGEREEINAFKHLEDIHNEEQSHDS